MLGYLIFRIHPSSTCRRRSTRVQGASSSSSWLVDEDFVEIVEKSCETCTHTNKQTHRNRDPFSLNFFVRSMGISVPGPGIYFDFVSTFAVPNYRFAFPFIEICFASPEVLCWVEFALQPVMVLRHCCRSCGHLIGERGAGHSPRPEFWEFRLGYPTSFITCVKGRTKV